MGVPQPFREVLAHRRVEPIPAVGPKQQRSNRCRVPKEYRITRVLVVDDHPFVRLCLVGCINASDDLEVVGECVDGPRWHRR